MTDGRALADLLADHELGPELGRGSYGIVWAAHHRQLHRDVAVKLLLATSTEDEARFRREAQLLGRLRHPHVVTVFDYREGAGIRAIVMESLSGGTLADHSARLSMPAIVAVTLAAASALEHVHRAGVLHRDVSPGNVMFDADGRVRVTDFGVAGAASPDAATTAIGPATSSFVGTPAYASPEQCALAVGQPGPPLSAASDQYALAAMLYEALSGSLPHDPAGGLLALCNRKLTEPPRQLSAVRPTVPAAIDAVVMRALDRSPADRFGSIEEFAVTLAAAATTAFGPAWLDESAVELMDPGPIRAAATGVSTVGGVSAGHPAVPMGVPVAPRRRWASAVIGVAVVGLLLGGGWWWADHRSANADAGTPTTTVAGSTELKVTWSVETGASVFSSPAVDGDRVVVGSDDGSLYALDASTGAIAWTVPTDGPVRSSPAVVAGHVYAAGNDGKLRAVDLQTGAVTWTTPVGVTLISAPRVVDDLVVIGADHLRAYDAATGAARWEATDTGAISSSSPAIIGRTAVVGSEDASVYAVDLDTGAVRWKLRTAAAVQSSPLAVSDQLVVVGSRDGRLYAIAVDTGTLVWSVDLGAPIKSSPAVVGDRIIVGTDAGTLVASDLVDGSPAWTYRAGDRIDSSPLVMGERVVVGSNDHRVHVVDAATGKGIATYETGGPVLSSPRQIGDDVVVGSFDGRIYRLTGIG